MTSSPNVEEKMRGGGTGMTKEFHKREVTTCFLDSNGPQVNQSRSCEVFGGPRRNHVKWMNLIG